MKFSIFTAEKLIEKAIVMFIKAQDGMDCDNSMLNYFFSLKHPNHSCDESKRGSRDIFSFISGRLLNQRTKGAVNAHLSSDIYTNKYILEYYGHINVYSPRVVW